MLLNFEKKMNHVR